MKKVKHCFGFVTLRSWPKLNAHWFIRPVPQGFSLEEMYQANIVYRKAMPWDNYPDWIKLPYGFMEF
ncbi:MAG: hypothetical protein R3F48_16475 [Candidatus Zixiibacteriota bacterium]